MSTELYRLTEDGRRLVSESFMRGDTELDLDKVRDEDLMAPMPESEGLDTNLSALDEEVQSAIENHPQFDTGIDRALAPSVHRHLGLTRRIAGDPGLWHWLTVVRYPELVRYRWEYRSEIAMREKFLGAGSDLYSNAIHRLWWIAELTQHSSEGTESVNDKYSLTKAVFDNQTIVNRVFDRWFARYRPAAIAICDILTDEPSPVIDETTRRFNHALTNVQLESLDEDDTREIVNRIVKDVQSSA